MYDKCYFCLDQLPKLKKESTASFFVNFGGAGVQKSRPTLLCDYLCCQRQNQKGGAGEQGGELPVQDQRGGQVRSQREVLGHLQEARKLQEDESVLRSVQLGNRGHTEGAEGAEQTDVPRVSWSYTGDDRQGDEALLQVEQEETWNWSYLHCGMCLNLITLNHTWI